MVQIIAGKRTGNRDKLLLVKSKRTTTATGKRSKRGASARRLQRKIQARAGRCFRVSTTHRLAKSIIAEQVAQLLHEKKKRVELLRSQGKAVPAALEEPPTEYRISKGAAKQLQRNLEATLLHDIEVANLVRENTTPKAKTLKARHFLLK